MGCTPSILSSSNQNRKDSGLFCANIGGGGNNSSSNNLNGNNDTPSNAICNQILVNSYSRGDSGVGGFVSSEKVIIVILFFCFSLIFFR